MTKTYKIADTMPRGIAGATGCGGCCFYTDGANDCLRPAHVESCISAALSAGINFMMAGYVEVESED